MPHHKKEVKLDTKDNPRVVNEIAEIKSCNSAIFLESRKHTDLYMWVSKVRTRTRFYEVINLMNIESQIYHII